MRDIMNDFLGFLENLNESKFMKFLSVKSIFHIWKNAQKFYIMSHKKTEKSENHKIVTQIFCEPKTIGKLKYGKFKVIFILGFLPNFWSGRCG
jgi:hypothetical protein